MKDLTAHSIGKHILQMALPIAAGMLFQTLYFRPAIVSLWLVRSQLRLRIPDAAAALEAG